MTRQDIEELLVELGEALSSGDAESAARCWSVPALILSEEGAIAVSDLHEVQSFFANSTEWYRSRGLVSTRPEIETLQALTPALSAIDVRWPAFDASGEEMSSEQSHYIVQADSEGRPRIRLALSKTT